MNQNEETSGTGVVVPWTQQSFTLSVIAHVPDLTLVLQVRARLAA